MLFTRDVRKEIALPSTLSLDNDKQRTIFLKSNRYFSIFNARKHTHSRKITGLVSLRKSPPRPGILINVSLKQDNNFHPGFSSLGFPRRLYPETVLYSATVDLVACSIYRARLHQARNFNRFNFKTREREREIR